MDLAFHHVHIRCPDARRTAQWYIDAFGAKLIEDHVVDGGLHLGLDLLGARLRISEPRSWDHRMGPGDASTHFGLEHFAVQTDDLDGLLARLASLGAEVLEGPLVNSIGSRVAFVRAPDDVRIEVFAPAR
jgi:catechol 2,3-dioxygenase-like lactoylglutathione lyase family enzyme